MNIKGSPLSAENLKRTTELGRELRLKRQKLRAELDGPRYTPLEAEAITAVNEYKNGAIYMVNERDGEVAMGISPSFPNDFRAA